MQILKDGTKFSQICLDGSSQLKKTNAHIIHYAGFNKTEEQNKVTHICIQFLDTNSFLLGNLGFLNCCASEEQRCDYKHWKEHNRMDIFVVVFGAVVVVLVFCLFL